MTCDTRGDAADEGQTDFALNEGGPNTSTNVMANGDAVLSSSFLACAFLRSPVFYREILSLG